MADVGSGVDRLVLWDVDGTLVDTRGIGGAVFDQALARVLGVGPPSRIFLSGKTDPQILREYLLLMEVDDPDGRLPSVIEALEAEVAGSSARLAETGTVLPGVCQALARLAADESVHQTVLTGNTRANAAVKLAAFGLDRWLDLEIGAYGSDHADRLELVPIALDNARRLRGLDVGAGSTWVVGDTANDLACARAGGVRCLLVATGRTPFDDLSTLAPDALRHDLSDVDDVLRVLRDEHRPEVDRASS